MHKHAKTKSGMVAIFVTAVVMVIMSLITLGFARIVQREQRQGLDNQLSTQAFYAAESGVNVVASQIVSSGVPTSEKNTCDVSSYGGGTIDAATPDVRFTCLMYDPTPETLVFNNGSIRAEQSKVIPINATPPLSTITFSWRDSIPANTAVDNSCNTALHPASTAWGNRIGMLQVDLIPINAGSLNRETLDQNTATILMHPCGATASSSAVSYDDYRAGNNTGIRRGNIAGTRCTNTGAYQCALTVTNLPNVSSFYVRIKSIYSNLNVEISGTAASGASSSFANAQIVVDSTGRANDVLRRIQVRLPLYAEYNTPEAAVQTRSGICKLLTLVGTATSGRPNVTSEAICN